MKIRAFKLDHRYSIFSIIFLLVFSLNSCNKKDKEEDEDEENDQEQNDDQSDCQEQGIDNSSTVEGYGILEKLSGIWHGPVYSSTPLGSYPEWIVDFRPISEAQISSKNELDSLNDIFMSFFIAKYGCNEYKMTFRNGGGFAGLVRNSYMVIDSVYESTALSFYRFKDPVSGGKRVYTDITFKGDSLIMKTYTNQYNTFNEPNMHMEWYAEKKDVSAAQDAIAAFNFPQKMMVRDFSTTFDDVSEAVFYSASADPYPEGEQPYLGNTNVNVTISNPGNPDNNKKVVIIITTEPLFNGVNFMPNNLIYRSRYVLVGAETNTGYNFNYMHPGEYYVNALYDDNGDSNFSSGDYMNSNFDVPFSLSSEGTQTVDVDINFQIP